MVEDIAFIPIEALFVTLIIHAGRKRAVSINNTPVCTVFYRIYPLRAILAF